MLQAYPEVYTPQVLAALDALVPFNRERLAIMRARIARRLERARERRGIEFLDPVALIRAPRPRRRRRAGKFDGSEIPPDLQRQ